MGKTGAADPWRKFKESISYLSLSTRPTNLPTDTGQMKVGTNPNAKGTVDDLQDTSSFETDNEVSPNFSSPPVAEVKSTLNSNLHSNLSARVNSNIRPLSLVRVMGSANMPPPRSNKRQSVGSMPTRKHPYPSKFSNAINACNTVAYPTGIKQMFYNSSQSRRRSVIYRKKIADSSFAQQKKNRGFKGFSRKIRHCFSLQALRPKKPEETESVVTVQEPEIISSKSISIEVSRRNSTVMESLFSRIMRVAQSMDFDESTVGSLIMILGEDEPEFK